MANRIEYIIKLSPTQLDILIKSIDIIINPITLKLIGNVPKDINKAELLDALTMWSTEIQIIRYKLSNAER